MRVQVGLGNPLAHLDDDDHNSSRRYVVYYGCCRPLVRPVRLPKPITERLQKLADLLEIFSLARVIIIIIELL